MKRLLGLILILLVATISTAQTPSPGSDTAPRGPIRFRDNDTDKYPRDITVSNDTLVCSTDLACVLTTGGEGGTECSTLPCDLDVATTLNNQNICLQNGTNCPTGVTDTFATIEVDGTPVSTNAPTLDFDGADFTLNQAPTDSFDVTIKTSKWAEDTEVTSAISTHASDGGTHGNWTGLHTYTPSGAGSQAAVTFENDSCILFSGATPGDNLSIKLCPDATPAGNHVLTLPADDGPLLTAASLVTPSWTNITSGTNSAQGNLLVGSGSNLRPSGGQVEANELDAGTFAQLPISPTAGDVFVVTNAPSAGDCSAGGGLPGTLALCRYSGSGWVALGDGGGGGPDTGIDLGAKGDLHAHNGSTDVALNAGAEGSVLLVKGDEAQGLLWSTDFRTAMTMTPQTGQTALTIKPCPNCTEGGLSSAYQVFETSANGSWLLQAQNNVSGTLIYQRNKNDGNSTASFRNGGADNGPGTKVTLNIGTGADATGSVHIVGKGTQDASGQEGVVKADDFVCRTQPCIDPADFDSAALITKRSLTSAPQEWGGYGPCGRYGAGSGTDGSTCIGLSTGGYDWWGTCVDLHAVGADNAYTYGHRCGNDTINPGFIFGSTVLPASFVAGTTVNLAMTVYKNSTTQGILYGTISAKCTPSDGTPNATWPTASQMNFDWNIGGGGATTIKTVAVDFTPSNSTCNPGDHLRWRFRVCRQGSPLGACGGTTTTGIASEAVFIKMRTTYSDYVGG